MTDYTVEAVEKNFELQAATALEDITADRVTLAGTPTNQQVIDIIDGVLERQAKEIRVLRKMLRSQE